MRYRDNLFSSSSSRSTQLEPFKAAIKENGETAVRVEPGCRGFSAVFEKDNPTRVRLFEIYENADAFKAHLETPHFSDHAQREGEITTKARRRSASFDCALVARRLVPAPRLGRWNLDTQRLDAACLLAS